MMGKDKVRDVDCGWAWVALMAAVFNSSTQAIFVISVGFFQVEFLESFSESKGSMALIGALALSGQTLLGPVAGIISNMLTHRIAIMVGAALVTFGLVCASFAQDFTSLLTVFGLLCGLGLGLIYTPSVTVISTYFYKYRTVANGIALSAPGLGVLISPFLMRWLIETFGWRFAMVGLSCFTAQSCVYAALFYPHDASKNPSCCSCKRKSLPPLKTLNPETQSLQAKEDRNLSRLKVPHSTEIEAMVGSRTAMHVSEFGSVLLSNSVVWTVDEVKSGTLRRLKHLLSQKFVWVMCLNQFLLMCGYSTNTILFPSFAQEMGITYNDLPAVYTVYGVTMTSSRILGGFIFSRIPHLMLKVFFFLQVCVALVLTLLPLYGKSLAGLFVYKFAIGMTYGPTFMLVTPILIHYIGLEDLSVAFGVLMLCCGFGYMIAPPLGGLMFDVFGSYSVSYFIAGAMVGIAALSLLLLLLIKDLSPREEAMEKHESSLLVSSQKESDAADTKEDNSSGTRENNCSDTKENHCSDDKKDNLSDTKETAGQEKSSVNGDAKYPVLVIEDMETLHKFVHDRCS